MTDVAQYFGSDLTLSANGDLLTADGLEESKQRVLRRLLTNPQDYLWQPTYGAGLPATIGQPLSEAELTALIKSQMYMEADVSHDPEPQVTLTAIPNGISAQITYISVESGEPGRTARPRGRQQPECSRHTGRLDVLQDCHCLTPPMNCFQNLKCRAINKGTAKGDRIVS